MIMLYFRLKEQDEVFMNQKKEYEREINHLRLLLQEKEHNLYDIATEKRLLFAIEGYQQWPY